MIEHEVYTAIPAARIIIGFLYNLARPSNVHSVITLKIFVAIIITTRLLGTSL